MIKYTKGDLFELTENSYDEPLFLAHACNCLGLWSGGIAAEFKGRYPASYKLYKNYCKRYANLETLLLGRSLIIPAIVEEWGQCDGVFIVCLFTSIAGEETPEEIVQFTDAALIDFKMSLSAPDETASPESAKMIEDYNLLYDSEDYVLNMPKINSGIFGVPWELTEKSLKELPIKINVFDL